MLIVQGLHDDLNQLQIAVAHGILQLLGTAALAGAHSSRVLLGHLLLLHLAVEVVHALQQLGPAGNVLGTMSYAAPVHLAVELCMCSSSSARACLQTRAVTGSASCMRFNSSVLQAHPKHVAPAALTIWGQCRRSSASIANSLHNHHGDPAKLMAHEARTSQQAASQHCILQAGLHWKAVQSGDPCVAAWPLLASLWQ